MSLGALLPAWGRFRSKLIVVIVHRLEHVPCLLLSQHLLHKPLSEVLVVLVIPSH